MSKNQFKFENIPHIIQNSLTNSVIPLLLYLRSPVPLPHFPFQREICKFPLKRKSSERGHEIQDRFNMMLRRFCISCQMTFKRQVFCPIRCVELLLVKVMSWEEKIYFVNVQEAKKLDILGLVHAH